MKELRDLQCHLTDLELKDRSRDMAKAAEDKRDAEVSKIAAAAAFNDLIKKAESTLNVIARQITTGREYRLVECVWDFDWLACKKTLIREDTGEVLEVEEVSEEERQTYLDLKA